MEAEEFQPLTEREEIDLQKVISGCDFAISNAEVFMEQLGKDLSILDGVCFKLCLTNKYFYFEKTNLSFH